MTRTTLEAVGQWREGMANIPVGATSQRVAGVQMVAQVERGKCPKSKPKWDLGTDGLGRL